MESYIPNVTAEAEVDFVVGVEVETEAVVKVDKGVGEEVRVKHRSKSKAMARKSIGTEFEERG